MIRYAFDAMPTVEGSDAFTHLVATFSTKPMRYPSVPPPRGVVVEAEGDTLTIRCAEPGTIFVHCGVYDPFVDYLRLLKIRSDHLVVAAVYLDEDARKRLRGVVHVPEIAWVAGGPEVHIRDYEDYPHKDKPHRILMPEGGGAACLIWGCARISASPADFRAVFPRGMPMILSPPETHPKSMFRIRPAKPPG